MNRAARVCAVLVSVLFFATACGESGPTDAERRADQKAAQKRQHKQEIEAAEAKQRAAQVARYRRCMTATKPLRDALGQLNSRLNVGLNYNDYGDRLGDVQVAYDGAVAGIKSAGGRCLGVAVPLENALNAYSKVLNLWGDCSDDYNCDFSEGETNDKAQAGWNKASRALDASDQRLAAMRPTT